MDRDPYRSSNITSVQEALDELNIPLKTFYRLRKVKEIPRLPGQRFITGREVLRRWFLSLISCPDRRRDNGGTG
jgi:hypothetical protein